MGARPLESLPSSALFSARGADSMMLCVTSHAWLSPPPVVRTPRSAERRAIRACADAVTVSTFNLWCPEYRRVGDTRESSFPEMYTQRQKRLLRLPVWQESDIVCCQEFWYASPDVFEMYVSTLRRRFKMHGLQRSGRRPDGLFIAIAHEWEVLHEEDLDFDDVAGRCAQVLHIRRGVGGGGGGGGSGGGRGDAAASQTLNPSNLRLGDLGDADGVGGAGDAGRAGEAGDADTEVNELLVANVHLMFQHSDEVARVRLREMYKVLAALDRYKATLAAPPPTLICGDLNGPTGSVVADCLARYGWRDSYSESSGCDVFSEDSCGWVSHLNHLGQAQGVDYIMVQSPSVPRRPAADWTDFVIQEIAQALLELGLSDPEAAWQRFSRMARDKVWDVQGVVEDDDSVDGEGFKRALRQLGFGAAPLTQREIDAVVASCDNDGNGSIDAAEWRVRFAAAVERLQTDSGPLIQDQKDSRADLECVDSRLLPRCLESGEWPTEDEWGLSDHGVVTSTFVAQRRGEAEVTAWLQARSGEKKGS